MKPNQNKILNLCRDILDGKEIECGHKAIERFISLISREYKDDISLAHVADFCCFTASHLSYLIKTHLDSSFVEIRGTIRLEAARRLLISNNDRITRICFDAGYTDLSNFEHKFKRLFGESPRAYRNNHKNVKIKLTNKEEIQMETQKHIDLLGLKCRDRVTGLKGVITCISFDLYGCVQAVVHPGIDEKGMPLGTQWYDVTRLEILDETPVMDVPDFSEGYIAEGKKGAAEKPMDNKA